MQETNRSAGYNGEAIADILPEPVARRRSLSLAGSRGSAFQPYAAHSGGYRRDIDGLRAVAVVLVLLFHAQVKGFSGGFVGVDVFFVISGYLITSLIIKDAESGRFSLLSFYERRMRRIFPALFAVSFVAAAVAFILYNPQDLADFGRSLAAMALFVANIFFKRESGAAGYFGDSSQTQPLLHTWSLSVEEQFYVLFPALLLLLIRYARTRVTPALAGMAGLSFVISVWAAQHRPLTAFYILIPRAWELLLGSLLAVRVLPALTSRVLRELAGIMGLGLIGWAAMVFTSDTTFPGMNAMLPCLGACALIYAGESGDSFARGILSAGPVVVIGVVSYSLYLWHWPILVFARYFSAGALTASQTAAALAASVIMAAASFVAVETPFRGKESRITRRQVFSLGLSALALSVALGGSFYLGRGMPRRYDGATRQLVAKNTERKSDFEDICGNWKKEIHALSDITFCKIGPDSDEKIMFWGDSYVQQLYPAIRKIHDEGGLGNHSAMVAIETSCIVATHLNGVGKGSYCDVFAKFALIRAQEADVDTVFIAFNTWWVLNEGICSSENGKCVERLSTQQTRRAFVEDLAQEVRFLKEKGKRVIVSLPFPMFDKSIPDLEIRNAVFGRIGLAGAAKDVSVPDLRDEIRNVARKAGAETFDPRQSLCPDGRCITEVGGVSIYKDNHHVAASQVGLLEDNLKQVLASSTL